jgi:hypothetical protein
MLEEEEIRLVQRLQLELYWVVALKACSQKDLQVHSYLNQISPMQMGWYFQMDRCQEVSRGQMGLSTSSFP